MKKITFTLVIAGALAVALLQANASTQQSQSAETLLGEALHQEEVEGNFEAAINVYQKIMAEHPDIRPVAAKALLRLAGCYEKLGQEEAQKTYEQLIAEYPEQQEEVRTAQAKLAALLSAQATGEKADKGIVIRKLGGELGRLWNPSPDGRYFAFNQAGDLAIRNIATGEVRRLNLNTNNTAGRAGVVGPSCWSPDGKRIAYSWESEPNEIRVVNFNGSGVRTIYKSQEGINRISLHDWSPDGEFILTFLRKQGRDTTQFGILNVEDGSLREFDWPVNQTTTSVFSLDGRYINFDVPQKDNQRNTDIVLYSLAQDKIIPLVENPAYDSGLGWSPDGRWFIFSSDRTGALGIWGLPVSDGKSQGDPVLIKKAMEWIAATLQMNKTGVLYYSTNVSYRDVYVAELDFDSNRVLDGPKRATEHYVNNNLSPAWSADGQFLAFASLRAGESHALCILSNETGEVREFIPRDFMNLPMILWPEDGRSVIHSGFDKLGNPGYFRTDLKTGEMSTLLEVDASPGAICLSRDEKTIFYKKFVPPENDNRQPLKFQLVAMNLETKKPQELYEANLAALSGLALSPEGSRLVFSEWVGGERPRTPDAVHALRILPVEGGEPQTIFETDKGGFIDTLDWTPDGRFILFAQLMAEKDGRNFRDHIWMIPAQGGEARELGIVSDSIGHLRISPDGRHIAFTSGGSGREIWAMENFLPSE